LVPLLSGYEAQQLPFDIGELLSHLAVPDAADIHASHVSSLAIPLNPPVEPADNATVSASKDLLGF
jgi:hypothetical protein